jgi:hypothetical protein
MEARNVAKNPANMRAKVKPLRPLGIRDDHGPGWAGFDLSLTRSELGQTKFDPARSSWVGSNLTRHIP